MKLAEELRVEEQATLPGLAGLEGRCREPTRRGAPSREGHAATAARKRVTGEDTRRAGTGKPTGTPGPSVSRAMNLPSNSIE